MRKLSEIFPNLNDYLYSATTMYNGGVVKDDDKYLVYVMPLLTFGKHIGDNYFNFYFYDEGYFLSFITKKNGKEYVKTLSRKVYNDLTFEEWEVFADDLLKEHLSKQEYLTFASGDFLKKIEKQTNLNEKNGCSFILSIIALVILAITFGVDY